MQHKRAENVSMWQTNLIKLYCAVSDYDIERSAYAQILEHLSTCTSSVKVLKDKLCIEAELSQIKDF